MNAERYAFDTNILFYALDDRDERKHFHARTLIGQANTNRCIIPLQTLGELGSTISRKQKELLPRVERLVLRFPQLFPVVPASSEDILEAVVVHQQHGLQFYDALLWATVRRAGCGLLLTEDLQDGRTLGGVTFRNPFHMTEADLAALLA